MTGKIIDINEQIVKDHLGELVRNTVEETLNGSRPVECVKKM
jgi:hypothetical protein